ncbi:glycosyltransferase family 2 protein [Mariniflexile sp.]|uniref:glycosyltransferase family 2 protein n=2 Tax=Mariniflexile sp. TaxID=1979402 RepID=UPI004047E7B2
MKLSVIILNYNVRYFLELCLKSVETAIATMDAEIIVVDNNSEDGSCNMVKELFPNVVLIENKDNLGFSKGNNIGVSLARGEYLCILNPDTVVAEDTFLQLLSFSERQENLGIVGCKLINGIGDFLPESKRNVPYVKTSFKKILGNSQGYYSNHLNRKDIGKVDILVGAFMFMKKALYETIGGFDEDYFMYGEDIDLSYKVLKAGYHNYYYGATTIIHFKGESTLKDKYYARRFYGAMQIFYKKHFKKNVCFNVFVWSGIRLAYLARKVPISKPKKVSDYVFISDKVNKNLEAALSTKLILQKDLNNLENNSEVILDNTVLSYKEIISMIENNKKDRLITFKILPKNSNFILGSDNAISRGEVVVFE